MGRLRETSAFYPPPVHQLVEILSRANPTRRRQTGKSASVSSRMRDPSSNRAFAAVVYSERLRDVLRALESIDPRLAYILIERFGIGEREERTLHSISESLGLSKERVRQLQKEGIRKLAPLLEEWCPWKKNGNRKPNRG